MSSRLLLTGIGGFIGAHTLTHLLTNTDWEIIGIDSFRHKGITDRITECTYFQVNRHRVKIFTHDLSAPLSSVLIDDIGPIDYIINMASNSHVDRSIIEPVSFIKNNIDLTLNMLEYARIVKPKTFITVSTDEVFGPMLNNIPHPEWDPHIPSNPYCLLPKTKIITKNGLVCIEDFSLAKDRVLSRAGGSNIVESLATNKFKYDYNGIVCNIMSDQGEITTTAKHKFFKLRHNGIEPRKIIEVSAEELVVNDYILMARFIPVSKDIPSRPNGYSRFLGYYLGDGSYSTKSHYVKLADQKKNYIEYYQDICKNLFGVSPKSSTKNFGNIYKHSTKDCWYLQFASENLRSLIDLSSRQNILDLAFSMSRADSADFIAGFFDAEAHYKYQHNRLISVKVFQSKKNFKHLECIQYLLRRFGIISRIRPENNGGANLIITDNISLQYLCANIPSFKTKIGSIFAKSQHDTWNQYFYWSQVQFNEKQQYSGVVYDLEVPKNHNYCAEYFIVHNSSSKSCQESISTSYWRTYAVPLIITGTMNNFGERQDPEKFVPMTIKKVLAGDMVQVHGKSEDIGSRYWLHARNHADALMWLLQNRKPAMFPYADRPDKYNVVGERRINNLDIAKHIADILGKPLQYELVDFHSTRPGHDPHYGLDGTKLQTLGWKAPVDFEISFEKTVKWALENPKWLKL